MGTYSNLNDVADEIKRDMESFGEEAAKIVTKYIDEGFKKSDREFVRYQRREIEKVFQEAVNYFYSTYEPKYYKRKYGLYNVIDIKEDVGGFVITGDAEDDYTELFNELRMHPGVHFGKHNNGKTYSGAALFKKVFMDGWHGGAEDIDGSLADIWGSHPDPGTPYYRVPGMVQFDEDSPPVNHVFGKWASYPAERAEISPYKYIQARLMDLEKEGGVLDQKYDELDEKYFKEASEKASKAVTALYKRKFKK